MAPGNSIRSGRDMLAIYPATHRPSIKKEKIDLTGLSRFPSQLRRVKQA
jgi:hypothetical protein